MLKKYIADDFDLITNERNQNYLREVGALQEGTCLDWNYIRAYLQNRKLPNRSKSLLLQIICNRVPTREWLNLHGYKLDAQCPCGMTDNMQHRLEGCPYNDPHGDQEQAYNRDNIIVLLHKKTPPVSQTQGDTIMCKINGNHVEHQDFEWEEGTTVYTDGSCKHVSDPSISVAASAAVQITRSGEKRTATLAISPEFPRSAVVAEHMALFVASYFAKPARPITVASDCQAVVQGASQTMEIKLNYRRKMGGFWMMIGENIQKVFKVKAHLTLQEATARNEG
jgi:ribonuclease HI